MDHDYAINECMWQNAGLVGVDPFYRGLKWEVQPEQCEAESGSRGAAKDKTDEPAFSAIAYVREWSDLAYKAVGKPSTLPPWPPPLHAALLRPRPSIDAVTQVAEGRRPFLKRAYQTGGRVSRVGLRVAAGDAGPTPAELACAAHLPTAAPAPAGQSAAPPASPVFCAVGHMRPRVPPIGGERSPWAALNQQLLEQQQQQKQQQQQQQQQQHLAGATQHPALSERQPHPKSRQTVPLPAPECRPASSHVPHCFPP